MRPCRLAILYHDWLGVKKLLARAKVICEAGGDWEHKNKLKVRPSVNLSGFWTCTTKPGLSRSPPRSYWDATSQVAVLVALQVSLEVSMGSSWMTW